MICPVCKRDLAPTLSICLTCGAMMNDTVREELETKITPITNSGKLTRMAISDTPAPPAVPATKPEPIPAAPAAPVKAATPQPPAVKAPAAKAAPRKPQTSELPSKRTSPTLVGFQPKTPTVPEWRLQLQNTVRQRSAVAKRDTPADAVSSGYKKQLVTNGANALKADFVEEAKPGKHTNPKVAKALERIEESRKAFMPNDAAPAAAPAAAARNYPFNVVSRSNETHPPRQADAKPAVNASAKPRLVSSLRIEKKKFDTNKLPPLPPAAEMPGAAASAEVSAYAEPGQLTMDEQHDLLRTHDPEPAIEPAVSVEPEAEENEELDDLAPIPHRFNAALFDLIIGGFAGLIVLSPFMISGGVWFSVSGVLAIAAATAIVTFIYLTLAIGLMGRTIGMRLFSLELIDAELNQYPSIHQAAVHSSLFILSLAFAGLGFLPMFFNEERRAVHDLLSGTILVREF